MAPNKKLPKPKDFGLRSFADLLNDRRSLPGEVPGSFGSFRAAMMQDLTPFTPYEITLAENLISIEWDIVQHRRMRDQVIRDIVLDAIREAIIEQGQRQHRKETTAAREAWTAAGHDPKSFKADEFDGEAAERAAADLARRSVDPDPQSQVAAHAEVADRGINLLTLMGEAYREISGDFLFHEDKLQELERRRRGVRSDLESLRKVRPIDTEPSDVGYARTIEP